ncbi:hypothetical protein BaRGS_00000855 [Batillaria attramentaria]|uniref:Uncharacterized protein n=1 Tax=Batillaria attramentaria TaxID=370345 RepID=A0ABD0M7H6_9CAEN
MYNFPHQAKPRGVSETALVDLGSHKGRQATDRWSAVPLTTVGGKCEKKGPLGVTVSVLVLLMGETGNADLSYENRSLHESLASTLFLKKETKKCVSKSRACNFDKLSGCMLTSAAGYREKPRSSVAAKGRRYIAILVLTILCKISAKLVAIVSGVSCGLTRYRLVPVGFYWEQLAHSIYPRGEKVIYVDRLEKISLHA